MDPRRQRRGNPTVRSTCRRRYGRGAYRPIAQFIGSSSSSTTGVVDVVVAARDNADADDELSPPPR
jgi:hypothetical protein